MAAQVRGYRVGRTSEPASVSASIVAVGASLKSERRFGSQSLSSSSSELQDSSSSCSSAPSPSSSSTLSLSSSPLTPIYTPKACNYQESNDKDHSQVTSSCQANKSARLQQPQPEKRRQPLTWQRSNTLLHSIRSPIVVRSSRASLSTKSHSSNSSSNESSRSSSKLVAPRISPASQLQRRAESSCKISVGQLRSSIRARASERTTRHLQLHYGSLCSLVNLDQQPIGRLRSNKDEPPLRRVATSHRRHPASSSPELIDVRGPQLRLCDRQSATQQFQQTKPTQVKQTPSCSVQPPQIKAPGGSTSSLLASSISIAAGKAAAAAAATRLSKPTASAITNSRLRQADLYARRHSQITSTALTKTTCTSRKTTLSASNRCPLYIRHQLNSSQSRAITIRGASTIASTLSTPPTSSTLIPSNDHAAAHASPRISSLRISATPGKSSLDRKSSSCSTRKLDEGQEKISISALNLRSTISSLRTQHQQRSNAAKRVKAVSSQVARDCQVRDCHHKTPQDTSRATTALNQRVAINSRSNWRYNLQPVAGKQISATKMTTALGGVASGNARYASQQQPVGTTLVAKNSGERSDGCTSSGSDSGSPASECCSASDCANDENVQPTSVARELPARENNSASGTSLADTTSAVACFKDNLDENNGRQHQQVEENSIEQATNIVKISANDDHQPTTTTSTAVSVTNPTLAVEATLATATTTTPAAECPSSHIVAVADPCYQTPVIISDGVGILASRDFSLNIVQNNNNNINYSISQQQEPEEIVIKRPLSDIETDCNGKARKQDTEIDMTNVKIKIQRKLSITPDVPIKTEPICLFYDLEARPFARGKFAQVKRCINNTSKLCFAAKCIKKRRRLVDIRHEIMLEIEALKLSHYTDHIVKLYEVYETPTEMILVLEMANGGELQRVIDDEEAIDEKIVKRMIRQILEGLVQLHDNDIAHLDIKPQNLLLTEPFPDGNVKLCDFGMSRRISKDCEIREICGTPDYVAPEILRYDPISLATDMWSLGVLTYVLLTGYSPFGSENRQQTFCNITQATLDFPSEIFYKISEDAVDFMQKLIVREPSRRLTCQQARNHLWLCQ